MLIGTVGATWRRWRAWHLRRAAIRELRALDNRTLKDMGLTRGEIVAAVDGQVYGREPARPHAPEPPSRPRFGAAAPRHFDRARDLRAWFIADLVRRSLGRLVRLLRRTVTAPLRREEAGRPTRRALRPLDEPAGHACTRPMKESRHAVVRTTRPESSADPCRGALQEAAP